jgi:hypothetical protein
MARARLLVFSLASAVCLALAPSALATQGALAAPSVPAKPAFHPRIGPALGILPPFTYRNGRLQPAQSAPQPLTPVTYHGGQTMTGGVTVHTIFWSGGTNPFQGRHYPWRVQHPLRVGRLVARHPAVPVEVRPMRLAPEHGGVRHRRPGPG